MLNALYGGIKEAISSLKKIIRVHLSDGMSRVKVGEKLHHAGVDSAQDWNAHSWHSMVGFRPRDEELPAHPPELAPGKSWIFVAPCHPASALSEAREVFSYTLDVLGDHEWLDNYVVVFREGSALPTRELLRVVNMAHAVVVLRGTNEYFYLLRDDFVLSTGEEEALVEWGVGRPLFANSLLAVGGTLLVAYAEKFWAPAVVGTLLVAAAEYRVQGTMTKVLRVRSPEWKRKLLVPSGMHGLERVVQIVLITLVALADLLEHRVLLLSALVFASVQVVLLEYVGQACLTWGFPAYHGFLRVQLQVCAASCADLVASLWVSYVFAGYVTVIVVSAFVHATLIKKFVNYHSGACSGFWVVANGLGIWAAVVGWNEADLKYSPQSLQPWTWPLTRAPDSFAMGARFLGFWCGVYFGCLFVAFVAVGVLSFRIGCDGGRAIELRKKTHERKRDGVFIHYDESFIPSRNLLVPDVRQQPQPAPIASAV